MKTLFLLPPAFLGMFFEAYVFQQLWAWFVVKTFGVPELELPVTVGLLVIVNFLKRRYNTEEAGMNEDERFSLYVRMMVSGFITAFITLGMGWVVAQFL